MRNFTRRDAIFNIMTAAALGCGLILRSFGPDPEASDDASDLEKTMVRIGAVVKKASFVLGAVSVLGAAVGAVCEIADAIRGRRVERMIKDYEKSGSPEDVSGWDELTDDDPDWDTLPDGGPDGDDVEIGPGGMIFGEKG